MKRQRVEPMHYVGLSGGRGVLIHSSSDMPYEVAKRFRKNVINAARMIQAAWRKFMRMATLQ